MYFPLSVRQYSVCALERTVNILANVAVILTCPIQFTQELSAFEKAVVADAAQLLF